MSMNRRDILAAAAAFGVAACSAPQVGEAAPVPFQPTRFSVEVRGSGPDVILIPGLTQGPDVWSSTVSALPGFRYHLIHVNGFAGAPAAGNQQGPVVAPLAEEIGRYIAARRLAQPALVGHSMGGTLALMVAAQRPGAVGKVMVVDMLPQPAGLFGWSSRDIGPLANSLKDLMGTPGGRQLVGSFVGAFGAPQASRNGSDPDVVTRAVQELAGLDLTPMLPRIDAPLTVVYASAGDSARARVDATYAQEYARAAKPRLVRIDNSGHMIMWSQPARFQAALREFLQMAPPAH